MPKSDNRSKKSLAKLLRSEELCLGSFQLFSSSGVAELHGMCGFDFIVIDSEHGALGPETIRNLIRAISGVGCHPIVRVPETRRSYVQSALDSGADGILFPQISSAEEALAAVQFCRYPPDGVRGLAPNRANSYGSLLKEYEQQANQDIAVLIQIENEAALKNLDQILAVPGIDLIFIGPGDLSQVLGVTGELQHPKVLTTVERVVDTCHNHKVAAGTLALDPTTWSHWLERGVKTLLIGSDLFFLGNEARRVVDEFRSMSKSNKTEST